MRLASEMNRANIRLRMSLNTKCRMFAFTVGNESRKHSAPYDAKNKCRVFAFSIGNESCKHSAPYVAKNKCRVFAFTVGNLNRANIRLRMALKINVGCLCLGRKWAIAQTFGSVLTLKIECRVFAFSGRK